MNQSSIIKVGIANIQDVVNSLYHKQILDEKESMLIKEALTGSDKTRKLLTILLMKNSCEWVPLVLGALYNSPETYYIYLLIKNTDLNLGSCDSMEIENCLTQADNRNEKGICLFVFF